MSPDLMDLNRSEHGASVEFMRNWRAGARVVWTISCVVARMEGWGWSMKPKTFGMSLHIQMGSLTHTHAHPQGTSAR